MGWVGEQGQVVGEPVVFDILFTSEPVTDYRSLQKADGGLARTFTTERSSWRKTSWPR